MNRAYFKDGKLYDVYPKCDNMSLYESRETAYKADIIVSDGIEYNLSSMESIASIPIPDSHPDWDAVLDLSYILKIRCGSVCDPVLLPAFVDKVLTLMQNSHLLWRRRDYLQVIRNYYRIGFFEEGDIFEQSYRSAFPLLFSNPADEDHEKEHIRTKVYFKKKWAKKHGI